MNTSHWLIFTTLLTLVACGAPGEAGDACTTDADCAEGLECHVHDHEGEDEEDEEHGDDDEGGVCEAHEEE